MRLLRTHSAIEGPGALELVQKTPRELGDEGYAILSHTWEHDGEITYEDLADGVEVDKTGASWYKIEKACQRAAADGYDYIWIDTLCIDRRSSSEQSEAVNSTFDWYRGASECYAHLTDGPHHVGTLEAQYHFTRCRWFARAWTLPELLAPARVSFFARDWTFVGDKQGLSALVAKATRVPAEVLLGERAVESASVAARMSWAARREAARPEDRAYALVGLFGVSMPVLYGEGGERAFLRLQEEILRGSDDQSLFAWADEEAPTRALHGLLARSPDCFLKSGRITAYQDWEQQAPYAMTNRGLRIELPLTERADGLFVAALSCPVPPSSTAVHHHMMEDSEDADATYLAIYLRKVSETDEQYARVNAAEFGSIRQRGPLSTVYVRQKPNTALAAGKAAAAVAAPGRSSSQRGGGGGGEAAPPLLRQHVLQLRSLALPDGYRVVAMLRPKTDQRVSALPAAVAATVGGAGGVSGQGGGGGPGPDPRLLIPRQWPLASPLLRGPRRLALSVVLERRVDGRCLAVNAGSSSSSSSSSASSSSQSQSPQPAFSAVELEPGTDPRAVQFRDMAALYATTTTATTTTTSSGSGRIRLESHAVEVRAARPVVHDGARYHLVDLAVEGLARDSSPPWNHHHHHHQHGQNMLLSSSTTAPTASRDSALGTVTPPGGTSPSSLADDEGSGVGGGAGSRIPIGLASGDESGEMRPAAGGLKKKKSIWKRIAA
ncbi:HET-domain-containing protein [Xylariaceae sp. FL0804]|nr:HET-domain-containing protein [Xylariaceae sp. FL0804]